MFADIFGYTTAMKRPVMRQSVHPSWLIASGCFGVVLGVIGSSKLTPGFFGHGVWPLLGTALLSIGLWRQKVWCFAVVLVAGSLIGLWRGSILQQNLTIYSAARGKTVTVRGQLSDDPDHDKNGLVTFTLKNITILDQKFPGKIWVSISQNPALQRSDSVAVSGRIDDGFASFAGSMYRANMLSIVRPSHADPALEVRNAFGEKVEHAITTPASQLGLGLLAGEKRALPDDVAQSFRIVSLTHIVVASGYNLTILVRLCRRLFSRVSKFLAAFTSGGLVLGFMAVTGNSPSMARAGLVSFLSLAAWYYGRKFHPMVILTLAAAITLLIDPSYGWNDLGWALSFASFAGVMLLAPTLHAYFFGDKKPGTLRQILGETMSAQIVTLPLIVLSFGYVSVIGIFANLIVVPLVPLAMLLTFMAGIGAWIMPSTAHIFGWPAQMMLNAMIFVSQKFAKLPWSTIDVHWNVLTAAGFYVILVAVWLYMKRVTRLQLRAQSILD